MRNEITIKIPTLLFEDMDSEYVLYHYEYLIDKEKSIIKFISVLREKLSYFWPEKKFDIDVDDYYQNIITSSNSERITERITEIVEHTAECWSEIIVLKEETLKNYNKLFEAEMILEKG